MAAKKAEKADEDVKQKRVFVITPIGGPGTPEREHADFVLHGAIKPVFEEAGYEVIRADTMADPSMITDGIFNNIFDCEMCIADLSFGNVNVYYELGVRHAQSLPVIHIAETGTKLPFDNAPHNTIFFSRTNWASFQELQAIMKAQLSTIEKPDFKVSNPITHARGRIEVSKSGDDKDQMMLDMMSRMESLERQIRRMGNRGEPASLFDRGPIAKVRVGNSIRRIHVSSQMNALAIGLLGFMEENALSSTEEIAASFSAFYPELTALNSMERDELIAYIESIASKGVDVGMLTVMIRAIA